MQTAMPRIDVLGPRINALGLVYYSEFDLSYICGIKASTDTDTEWTIYWSTDYSKAINVLKLCKLWGTITAACKAYNMHTEALIGCTSNRKTSKPQCLRAVGATLYLTDKGVSHQETVWDEVTAEWLYKTN